MQRIHHTDAPELDLTRTYNQTFFKKPLGLWYDVDGSWEEFSVGNMERSPNENHFLLDIDRSKMLVIDSMEKLKAFHDEFSYTQDKFKGIACDMIFPDWKRLAELYSGIEIAPCQKFPRILEMYFWFALWSVASGCIWDLKVINKIEKK